MVVIPCIDLHLDQALRLTIIHTKVPTSDCIKKNDLITKKNILPFDYQFGKQNEREVDCIVHCVGEYVRHYARGKFVLEQLMIVVYIV